MTRFFLRRSWIIRPGLETREPAAAVERYGAALSRVGVTWAGKRVLVFGYGGLFSVGAELLRRGAKHVVLCDRFAPPDNRRNRELSSNYPDYFSIVKGQVRPQPDFLTLLHADIRSVAVGDLPRVDVVLSSSVFEHLDDVEGITQALACVTAPSGWHLHFVDLRDHYFKRPFEMLVYSERVWRSWLNPTSNLNRFRLWDYQKIFEKFFDRVEMHILERDRVAFARARGRIRPEFVSEDADVDSATIVMAVLHGPREMKYFDSTKFI